MQVGAFLVGLVKSCAEVSSGFYLTMSKNQGWGPGCQGLDLSMTSAKSP